MMSDTSMKVLVNIPKYVTVGDNAMSHLHVSCRFDESTWNTNWFIMLRSSFGMNYTLNEYGAFRQYGPYEIPSEKMPCHIHHAKFVELKWNFYCFIVLIS